MYKCAICFICLFERASFRFSLHLLHYYIIVFNIYSSKVEEWKTCQVARLLFPVLCVDSAFGTWFQQHYPSSLDQFKWRKVERPGDRRYFENLDNAIQRGLGRRRKLGGERWRVTTCPAECFRKAGVEPLEKQTLNWKCRAMRTRGSLFSNHPRDIVIWRLSERIS